MNKHERHGSETDLKAIDGVRDAHEAPSMPAMPRNGRQSSPTTGCKCLLTHLQMLAGR